METHPTDPIISEVRAVRDAHAARFDYDVAAIFRDIRGDAEKIRIENTSVFPRARL